MEDSAGQQQHDRIISSSAADAGERPVGPDNLIGQPVSPKDERTVSSNPSLDAASRGLSRNVTGQPEFTDAGGDLGTVYSHIVYTSHEQTMYYGGYDNSTGGYPQYVNVDGLQVVPPPVIYNENSSLMYHTGYGYNHEMTYGQQYSPVAAPLSVVVDGQLYSPQQVPFSPSYYPQPVAPSVHHISSTVPISQTELLTPQSGGHEGFSDNMHYSPSGYFVPFGTFGGGDLSGNSGFYNLQQDLALGKNLANGLNSTDSDVFLSPLSSPAAYPQPIGVLGSYEHNVGQRPMHGFGLVSSSSAGRYSHGSSYQSSNFGSGSVSRLEGSDRNRLGLDKGRRRERDRDSIYISNDSYDFSNDRNRGPRASKQKEKSSVEDGTLSSMRKNSSSASVVSLDLYNLTDFVTDYESAKFFIIKSFSEDNVHKSIKYNVWASTPLGNRKLDASYHEAKERKGNCPVFLLFSVNASAQFCGVAEMVGPVDFEKDAGYWQQDRWSGQFPVQWHIIKDVPNSRFRHILLENNENKPVTHSRDTQEVKLEQGVEMLRIFKNHEARTSILDDFEFYNERERTLQDRKAKQKTSSKSGALVPLDSRSASSTADVPASLANDSPSTATNVPVSDIHLNEVVENFAETLKLEGSGKDVSGLHRGGE